MCLPYTPRSVGLPVQGKVYTRNNRKVGTDLALYNTVHNSPKHGCEEGKRQAWGLAHGSRQRNEDLCGSLSTLTYM